MRAEPVAATEATAATVPTPPGPRWLLPAGAALLVAVLAAWIADLATHLSYLAAMRDLVVYRDGGLIVRHVSPAYDAHRASPLYDWVGQHGVQFTYPPFAAVLFSVASVLSWTVMRWAMTLASLAALGLSLWLVFGALSFPGGGPPPPPPPTPVPYFRSADTAATCSFDGRWTPASGAPCGCTSM
jgi:alpha-1,2-mannosyltransferase